MEFEKGAGSCSISVSWRGAEPYYYGEASGSASWSGDQSEMTADGKWASIEIEPSFEDGSIVLEGLALSTGSTVTELGFSTIVSERPSYPRPRQFQTGRFKVPPLSGSYFIDDATGFYEARHRDTNFLSITTWTETFMEGTFGFLAGGGGLGPLIVEGSFSTDLMPYRLRVGAKTSVCAFDALLTPSRYLQNNPNEPRQPAVRDGSDPHG